MAGGGVFVSGGRCIPNDWSSTEDTAIADTAVTDTDGGAADTSDTSDVSPDDTGDGPDTSADTGIPSDTSMGSDAETDTDPRPACSNGEDDDGDGLIDIAYDLGCWSAEDDDEAADERSRENRWSTFDPAPETRIIYVSSSRGDDANEGTSPDAPLASIEAGLKELREGKPDWLLLRRGDTFEDSIDWNDRSGQGPEAPKILGSYGEESQRPQVRSGARVGIDFCCGSQSHVAVLDIDFYAQARDPDHPEFQVGEGEPAVDRCCDGGENVLFEGNRFRYYAGLVLQTGDGLSRKVEFRRNVVAFSYATDGSGASGVYASEIDELLIEANVFDHNGWMPDIQGAEAKSNSHAMYLGSGKVLRVRDNIVLRSASGGTHLVSEEAGGYVDVDITDNVYVGGEVGISLGGMEAGVHRYRDVRIIDNVLADIGRKDRTGNDIAWGIQIADLRAGSIAKNYVVRQRHSDNNLGIALSGETMRDVTVGENVIYDIGKRAIDTESTDMWTGVRFEANAIQNQEIRARLVDHNGPQGPVTYTGNTYWSEGSESQWFRVDNSSRSFEQWSKMVSTGGAQRERLTFDDPERGVGTYHATIGGRDDLAYYAAEARKQSKFNWRAKYTARKVAEHIRKGFETK